MAVIDAEIKKVTLYDGNRIEFEHADHQAHALDRVACVVFMKENLDLPAVYRLAPFDYGWWMVDITGKPEILSETQYAEWCRRSKVHWQKKVTVKVFDLTITCDYYCQCGKPMWDDRKPAALPVEFEGICYSCYFWQDVLTNTHPVIVDGKAYHPGVHGMQIPNREKGFGGQVFRWCDNMGNVHVCDNMWFRGEIPEYWRTRPEARDNAVWIRL